MNTKLKIVLRWVAFLPAAFVGSAVGGLGVKLITYLTFPINPSRAEIFIADAIQSVAYGVGFVLAGTYIAPSSHRIVAFVLCGIAICIASILVVFAVFNTEWYGGLHTVILGIAAFFTAKEVSKTNIY